jgi:hypothetical protein
MYEIVIDTDVSETGGGAGFRETKVLGVPSHSHII